MSALARVRSWWRALTHRSRLESEMETELSFHVESYVDDLMREGMSREAATRRARLELGGLEVQKEKCRDQVGLRPWDELRGDLIYAVRRLRKSPGFTLVAVSSLALGIGANTAIFTVAKKVLFDTLHVKNPQTLHKLAWVSGRDQPMNSLWGEFSSTPTGGATSTSFSYAELEQLRKRTDVFQDLVAFKELDQVTVTADGHPAMASGELLSGNTFDALGVEPVLGRMLTPADDTRVGASPVAVISEGYWAERFGKSTAVVGKTIWVNSVPLTIVGVSPRSFTGLRMGAIDQVFVPVSMKLLLIPRLKGEMEEDPQDWWLPMIARLREGVTEAQAQSTLDTTFRQTAMATLSKSKGMDQFHLVLRPGARGDDNLQSQFSKPVYVLLAMAGLVLLLACVNLANLLLAQASARQREMSTRLALGAGRGRILRQVLTESLLLSLLGGLAGFALGYAARNAIPRLLEDPWQGTTLQLDFDWKVLLFTVSISLATGVIFGIVPAWQATRANVNTGLKDATHATQGRQKLWLGKGLVIVQVALSSILLIGAGLFVRTLINLGETPLGFRPDHVLLFALHPPRARYSDTQTLEMYRRLEEKLAAIPGVKSETMSEAALIANDMTISGFHVSGQPKRSEDSAWRNVVGTDFFATMGITLREGRAFSPHDTATSLKVAVVNRTLERKFFGNASAVGKTFVWMGDQTVEIVGVANDAKYADLRTDPPPTFYMVYSQWPKLAGNISVELRTAGDPRSILGPVRAAVESIDRDLPLIDVRTQEQQIDATMSSERVFAQLAGGFGLLALLLASIGIYGLMAYTVSRRTSEIGIRMALGARGGQVLWMVLRESSWMALAGVALGTGVALWVFRFVATMLYGLKASDPAVLAGAAALLLVIALLAGFGPALRASRVDPMQALRHE